MYVRELAPLLLQLTDYRTDRLENYNDFYAKNVDDVVDMLTLLAKEFREMGSTAVSIRTKSNAQLRAEQNLGPDLWSYHFAKGWWVGGAVCLALLALAFFVSSWFYLPYFIALVATLMLDRRGISRTRAHNALAIEEYYAARRDIALHNFLAPQRSEERQEGEPKRD